MESKNTYAPVSIPPRGSLPEVRSAPISAPKDIFRSLPFAEIEIEGDGAISAPMPVIKTEPISAAASPERALFTEMRRLAFDGKTDHTNRDAIFYRQAKFMKDYEDDYAGAAPFSQFYPYYQLMSYEQLRTYFAWRTNARKGVFAQTSLSYVFLYIYELLSNVGVASPKQGLERLVDLWRVYGTYTDKLDPYMADWIRDYHVYYYLPVSFREFALANGMTGRYAQTFIGDPDAGGAVDLYNAVSKYDVTKSSFYQAYEKLFKDCFYAVVCSLRDLLASKGHSLESLIYQPEKREAAWRPFERALFVPWLNQGERVVEISRNEVYTHRNGRWTRRTASLTDSGRAFAGYIIKKTEECLRKAVNYKYKLIVQPSMADHAARRKIDMKGFGAAIERAVAQFYAEANKIVVTVDAENLTRIRREADITQERLIVPEAAQGGYGNKAELDKTDTRIRPGVGGGADITQERLIVPEALQGGYGDKAELDKNGTHIRPGVGGEADIAREEPIVPEAEQGGYGNKAELDTNGARIRPGVGDEADIAREKPIMPDAPQGGYGDKAELDKNGTHIRPGAGGGADITQERLIVPDEPDFETDIPVRNDENAPFKTNEPQIDEPVTAEFEQRTDSGEVHASPGIALWKALTRIEAEAVRIILRSGDIRKYAAENGVMPEVLIGGINEKAADAIGDSMIDFDGVTAEIYEDYLEMAEEMGGGR
ncbi:MAG: TerB N-terminal domain-containing protein [Defluviitaleaceae bacterium]|nr:TerB N-terminal domain-containing protein [Defluviitaleaceae bacterium]